MPGIAAGVRADHARFYWHLGDFRANSDFDQDILSAPEYHTEHLAIADYRCIGWDDFIQQQINPFENVPVYLAIGNHELVSPKRGQSICNNLLTGPTRRRFGRSGSRTIPTITRFKRLTTGLWVEWILFLSPTPRAIQAVLFSLRWNSQSQFTFATL
jgi:hypothetical protein